MARVTPSHGVAREPIPTPWASASPHHAAVSATHASLEETFQGHDAYHHYYKKHMTMLGLRKELDSSDTDSENSDNFQTKLFRRRQHRLKPLVTMRDKEQAAIEERRRASPWVTRCSSVAELGDDEPRRNVPKRRNGKRVFRDGHASSESIAVPTRPMPRLNARERLAQAVAGGTTSMVLPLTEGAAVAERRENERLERRRCPPPQPGPGPSKHQYDPIKESCLGAAPPRRSGASQRTLLSIERRVAALAKEHAASMQHHRTVMACIHGLPIMPCD